MKVVNIVTQKTGSIMLQFVWYFIHLVTSIWYIFWGTIQIFESYLISSGLLKKYKDLSLNGLGYLAIVVESEEARDTSRVVELLCWLLTIGVKHVCLYDMDGVLKKSKDIILKKLGDASLLESEADKKDLLHDQSKRTLEFASSCDGKEGIAKAANYLCFKDCKLASLGEDNGKPVFTETNLSWALGACGFGGPDPNLLLIYGPARCHLGFPAWRMRYTEIVHMGPLKSMKYGALVKAIYQFMKVHQNYGA